MAIGLKKGLGVDTVSIRDGENTQEMIGGFMADKACHRASHTSVVQMPNSVMQILTTIQNSHCKDWTIM